MIPTSFAALAVAGAFFIGYLIGRYIAKDGGNNGNEH